MELSHGSEERHCSPSAVSNSGAQAWDCFPFGWEQGTLKHKAMWSLDPLSASFYFPGAVATRGPASKEGKQTAATSKQVLQANTWVRGSAQKEKRMVLSRLPKFDQEGGNETEQKVTSIHVEGALPALLISIILKVFRSFRFVANSMHLGRESKKGLVIVQFM